MYRTPFGYSDLLRVDIKFPTPGYTIPAQIWLHRRVIDYFKEIDEATLEAIQKRISDQGAQFWGEETGSSFFVGVRDGFLRTWNCVGNACGYDIDPETEPFKDDPGVQWLCYVPHNLDSGNQFVFLLAAAQYFCNAAANNFRANP